MRLNSSDAANEVVFTASASPFLTTEFGARRYTHEFGSAGKAATTMPSSGQLYRFVRFGTISFVSDPQNPQSWQLSLSVSYGATKKPTQGTRLDYVLLVPVRSRMAGPTNKTVDASYPMFINSTKEITRILRADGTAAAVKPNTPPFPSKSLGGQLPELPTGRVRLSALISLVAPDGNPNTAHAVEAVLPSPMTIHAAVTPRYFIARDE
jgi:hypothetical protein